WRLYAEARTSYHGRTAPQAVMQCTERDNRRHPLISGTWVGAPGRDGQARRLARWPPATPIGTVGTRLTPGPPSPHRKPALRGARTAAVPDRPALPRSGGAAARHLAGSRTPPHARLHRRRDDRRLSTRDRFVGPHR